MNFKVILNRVRYSLRDIEKDINNVDEIAREFVRERRNLGYEIDKEKISDLGYVNVNFNVRLLNMLNLNEERHQVLNNISTKIAIQLSIVLECLEHILDDDDKINRDYDVILSYLLIRIKGFISNASLNEMPRSAIAILVTREMIRVELLEKEGTFRILKLLKDIKDNLCPPVIPE